jgi:signal transduction histidine kinase
VGRLAPDTEAAIYRVVQEALHNVAQHSRAQAVNIQIAREGNEVLLLVEDDGVGISKPGLKHDRQTFGLEGIRERIGMLGGQVNITSAKGKGMQLQIRVPAERNGLETIFPVVSGKAESIEAPADDSLWPAQMKTMSGGSGSMH